jgi:hypothetical protein
MFVLKGIDFLLNSMFFALKAVQIKIISTTAIDEIQTSQFLRYFCQK